MCTRSIVSSLTAITLFLISAGGLAGEPEDQRMQGFEKRLDGLRQELKIPAISAGIAKDGSLIWARGMGYADLEAKTRATPHTPYHLASLTKTFASTIVLQLVQEGRVSLEDPVSRYAIDLESDGVIRVKHIFSHTSEGVPGERYSYSGDRFGRLDNVIEGSTGRKFAELLTDSIFLRLDLEDTAPNIPPLPEVPPPADSERETVEAVRARLDTLMAAYNRLDVEKVKECFARDMTGFEAGGEPLSTFLEEQELRQLARMGGELQLRSNDVRVSPTGTGALLTCTTGGLLSIPGRAVETRGPWRTTYLYAKEDAIWKIVHAHLSPYSMGSIVGHQKRYRGVLARIAKPYRLDNDFEIVPGEYPTYFGTAAGLVSSVVDIARYDSAIDRHMFLEPETQEMAFTATVSTTGQTLPYGLGWFVQDFFGTKLVWHYGYWTCNSSLILKIPEQKLTFIVLANTDNLSRPTNLGAGDVLVSPMGLAFLKTFLFPEKFGEEAPEIDWGAPVADVQDQMQRLDGKPYEAIYRTELLSRAMVARSVGGGEESVRLFGLYGKLYSRPLPGKLGTRRAMAEILDVTDDEDRASAFTLETEQQVRILALGEGFGGEMYDYGWIEEAEGNEQLWVMKQEETTHAGGAGKNRIVDTVMTLPAGRYRLRFKSDDSHSFDRWNSTPPDYRFWGISLFREIP
jgi:CubicO group peptidase (beta-lactamase class C family)